MTAIADGFSVEQIYASAIGEAMHRLAAARFLHDAWVRKQGVAFLDGSILQMRMALEYVAFAAIAPDKETYQTIRGRVGDSYHARKIFEQLRLAGVPNPYPVPVVQSVGGPHVAFQRREAGFLTERQFANLYDRLGKHLHADNPWGPDKQRSQLGTLLPTYIGKAEGLLEMHFRFVQTGERWQALLARASADNISVFLADADGPFEVRHT